MAQNTYNALGYISFWWKFRFVYAFVWGLVVGGGGGGVDLGGGGCGGV